MKFEDCGDKIKGAWVKVSDVELNIPMACPETGAFVAYKIACRLNTDFSIINPDVWCVIKLEIPEDAKRSSATGRKCRASKAKVLGIESVDRSRSFEYARSTCDRDFFL